jgi:hypothetical protein
MTEAELNRREQLIYLKGYNEGFMSALKLCWFYAEEVFVKVNNDSKKFVQIMIDKIKT